MQDPSKTEQYHSELDMILRSNLAPSVRMVALAKLFHRLVITLTDDERMVFRNFYARFRYLLAAMPMSVREGNNLENFRRLLNEEDGSKIDDRTVRQGVWLIQLLLSHASGEKPPANKGYLPGYFTKLYPKRNYAKLADLRLLASSWTSVQREADEEWFILHAFDLRDLEQPVEVVIRKLEHHDYTSIRRWLRPEAVLYFEHLHHLKESRYETSFDTLITLEPDFLIDASEIGDCHSGHHANSDLFFLSRLVSDLPGASAVKGSIVGYYLDEMVRDPGLDKKEIFKAAVRQQAMKAAHLGRKELLDIWRSVQREHLPNIEELVRRERKKELWIEPTYFSTEYGLQGRLDLLCRTKDTQDIIELKSGSSPLPNPSAPVYPNHKVQVVCYDMMLESTYGKNRKGFNTVFYSKCPQAPYRNLVSEHLEKRQVLEIRNEIVDQLFQLADREFSLLGRIKDQGIKNLPRYKEASLAQLQLFYQPGRIATEYYQEMMAFLLRELINTKTGSLLSDDKDDQVNGFAGLWLDAPERKEEDFRVIYDLEMLDIGEGKGHVRLKLTKRSDHAFRKGDLVVLYPQVNGSYEPLRHHILKGSLDEIGHDWLVISLNNKQTEYGFIRSHSRWAVEPDMFEKNYWTAIACLFNVLTASPRKKRLLFGHEEPGFQVRTPIDETGLTAIQRTAIQQALNAQDYYLLQGPPGTGKTSTFLVSYVQQALRQDPRPIVILAFTNKAVDKICEHFCNPRQGAAIPYLRLGGRHTDDKYLFSRQIQGDDPDGWRRVIDGHRVFVSTVATFHNNWQLLKQFISFGEVIVDEASQLTEAVLSSVLALFDKFVLIGDHKQLPAVISQRDRLCRIQSEHLVQLGITDLRISLFERLMKNAIAKGWTHAYGQLSDHYRMHQDIASLIEGHYRTQLCAGSSRQQEKTSPYTLPPDHFLQPLSHHRVIFIQTPEGGNPKRNEKEALMAATIANELVASGAAQPGEIGIITPFRAQITAIKEHLRPALLKNDQLIIDTVERYQGDERKIIIFSTTISDPRQVRTISSIAEDEVSATDRKLLVSVSRAVDQLIVLGDADTLQSSPMYAQLLDHIRDEGGWLGQFSFE